MHAHSDEQSHMSTHHQAHKHTRAHKFLVSSVPIRLVTSSLVPYCPCVIPHNVRTKPEHEEKRGKAGMITRASQTILVLRCLSMFTGYSSLVAVHWSMAVRVFKIVQLCRKFSGATCDHIMFCLTYSQPPLSSLPFSNTYFQLLSQPFLVAMPPWQITYHLAFLP